MNNILSQKSSSSNNFVGPNSHNLHRITVDSSTLFDILEQKTNRSRSKESGANQGNQEDSIDSGDLWFLSGAENNYSQNPEVQRTIEKLLSLGLPPIPVAPKQDPRLPGCHAISNYGSTDKPQFCPLIEESGRLNPKPRFTGKNPSYLDRDGTPRIFLHGKYHDKLPEQWELRKWFANPNTGVGTLGGHGGVDWIDIDSKCFSSQEECDAAAMSIINAAGAESGWIERTGSNGWRIAIVPEEKPDFTNFALSEGGHHIGEALFKGRFTVLAPSVHPNGNRYQRISDGVPTNVASLAACGVYPAKDEVATKRRAEVRQVRQQANLSYGLPAEPHGLDIREFAKYFDGYEERRNGWGYAKCPHHNGISTTSFRIHLTTGQFKLWCGCDGSEAWHSGLELAKSRGYVPPAKPCGARTKPAKVPSHTPEDTIARLKAEADRRSALYRQDLTAISDKIEFRNERFLSDIDVLHGVILAICSPMETGKTQWLKVFVDRHSEAVIDVIGYRVALGRQTAKRIGVAHISEFRKNGVVLQRDIDEARWLALCLDSLLRRVEAVANYVNQGRPYWILLDECDAVLKHLFNGGTLKGKQAQVFEAFVQLLQAAIFSGGGIVALEANLSLEAVKFLKEVTGAPIHTILNEYRGRPWDVEVATAVSRKGVESDRLLGQLAGQKHLELIQSGERVFQTTRAQEQGRILERVLASAGGLDPQQVFVLDSLSQRPDSPTQEDAGLLVCSPEAFHKGRSVPLRSLICTPTVESGFSHPDGYFDSRLDYAAGGDARESCQRMGRLRSPQAKVCLIAPTKALDADSGVQGFTAEQVLKNTKKRFVKGFGGLSNSFSTELWDKFTEAEALPKFSISEMFHRWQAEYIARGNREKANLREEIIIQLLQAGHKVTFGKPEAINPDFARLWKDARNTVKQGQRELMAQQEYVDPATARHKLDGDNLSLAEEYQAKKSLLLDRFPGTEAFWNHPDVLKHFDILGRKDRIKRAEWLFYANNPGCALHRDRQILQAELGMPFVRITRKAFAPAASALKALEGAIDACVAAPYNRTTPAAIELARLLAEHRDDLHDVTGLDFCPENGVTANINKFLRWMGFSVGVAGRYGPAKGMRCRTYSAHLSEMAKLESEVLRSSLEVKWSQELEAFRGEVSVEVVADMSTKFLDRFFSKFGGHQVSVHHKADGYTPPHRVDSLVINTQKEIE